MMVELICLLLWIMNLNIKAESSLKNLLEIAESNTYINHTFHGDTYANDNILKTLIGDGYMQKKEISPFSFYLKAIRSAFYQDMHQHEFSTEIIVEFPCSSQVVSDIRSQISDIKVFSHCHQLLTKLDPYEMHTILNEFSSVIFMVPWYLSEFFLTKHRSKHISVITIEVSQQLIESLQTNNPFLLVTNLMFDAKRDNMKVSNTSKVARAEPSNCVQIYEKVGNVTRRHKVHACHEIPVKVVNVVTRYRDKFVFPSFTVKPKHEKCDSGVLCKKYRDTINETEVWDSFCCFGQEIEILQSVFKIVNLPYNVYFVKDGKFGSYKDGRWDGMINDLVTKKADVAMYQFTILPKRHEFVEYANKILSYRVPVGLVIKKENNAFKVATWSSFTYVEIIYVIYIPMMIVLIMIFIIAFENIAHWVELNDRYEYRTSFTYMASIVFQRDVGGKPPKRWAGRIVAIAYSLTMTIFIGYYTAQIAATNIYYQKSEAFKGIDDVRLHSPKFRLGLHKSSYYEEILNSRPDIKATRVYITSWVESVADVNNGLLDGTIGSSISMESIISKNQEYCKNLLLHYEEKFTEGEAWAYQRGSIVGDKVSDTIQKLIEDGEIHRIQKRWADISMCGIGKEATSYPWQYAIGPLIVLAGSVGFCLLIYPLEFFYVLWKRKKARCYAI